MRLTYWSHSSFLLETKLARIVIDPFLAGNPKAPLKPADVECEFIIVTHGHNDHLTDAIAIAKRNRATIIANFEIATLCSQQGLSTHPLHIGGGYDFPFGRVKLTIAHHGSGYQTGTGFIYCGNPAGALITADGSTVYHAGDTGLFMDMELIGRLNHIDLAMLPIGDNFTMGIDDAVEAVKMLKPGLAVPMHYNTFDVIKADPAVFARKVEQAGGKARVMAVKDTIEV